MPGQQIIIHNQQQPVQHEQKLQQVTLHNNLGNVVVRQAQAQIQNATYVYLIFIFVCSRLKIINM